jgi:hypothetical protein
MTAETAMENLLLTCMKRLIMPVAEATSLAAAGAELAASSSLSGHGRGSLTMSHRA